MNYSKAQKLISNITELICLFGTSGCELTNIATVGLYFLDSLECVKID